MPPHLSSDILETIRKNENRLENLRSIRRRYRILFILTKEWYYERNPEAALFPGGPSHTTIDTLSSSKCRPGPNFNTRAYLIANPDVLNNRTNPLNHYIRHGLREGRGFAPLHNTPRTFFQLLGYVQAKAVLQHPSHGRRSVALALTLDGWQCFQARRCRSSTDSADRKSKASPTNWLVDDDDHRS